MSTKYKASEADTAYFITITTVGWIDYKSARTGYAGENNLIENITVFQYFGK